MSSKYMVRAWQVPGLRPAARLVLLALADCADWDGRNAFRSERTIAEHTNLSLRTVKSNIQTLKVMGLISVQEMPTNRRSTTYQLNLPGGAGIAPQANAPRGARIAPLEGKLWVQHQQARGAKADIAYKDKPVNEPVDPQCASLLAKAVTGIRESHPGLSGVALVQALHRWAASRNLPRDLETLAQAIQVAEADAKARTA